jgi:hypothetical protein
VPTLPPRDAAAEPRDRGALDGPRDETRPDTVARVDAVLAIDGLKPDAGKPDMLKPDAAVPLPPPVCAGRLCWQNPRPVGVKRNGVWGTGPNNVYVVGAGIVLRWDGTSWSAQDLGPNSKGETFWAISGCSANDIYVLGSHLYRFDGSSWKQVDPLGGFFYHDLVCAGPKAVVAVGQSGQVKRFDGTQWLTENAGTSTDLRGVWAAGPSEIGAVGEDGSVLGFDGLQGSRHAPATTSTTSTLSGAARSPARSPMSTSPARR